MSEQEAYYNKTVLVAEDDQSTLSSKQLQRK